MDNKKPLIIGIVAFTLLLGGAALLYQRMDPGSLGPAMTSSDGGSGAGDSGEGGEQLRPAPDFTVLDRDGDEVSLSDLKGKPVVVSFWASWCDVCKTGMPDFDAAYAKYGSDVHFMMVNLTSGSETREIVEGYIDEKGYGFPIYFDTEMSAASAYGVNAVPVTYLVDAEGMLVAYGQGRLGPEGIERGIEMVSGDARRAPRANK